MPCDVPPGPWTNIKSANGSDNGAYKSEMPSLVASGSADPVLWRNSLVKVKLGVIASTLVSRVSAAAVQGSEVVAPDAPEGIWGCWLVSDDLGCLNS